MGGLEKKPGAALEEIPALYAIANVDEHLEPLGFVEALLQSGARWIQIRAKKNTGAQLSLLVTDALKLAANFEGSRIIVNDSVEVCRDAGAHGVHLGQSDADPRIARQMLGAAAIIGLSTHNLHDATRAQPLPIDYIGCGPIFTSPTKQGHAPELGTEKLKEICQRSQLPVVAIGGIDRKNARTVFEAGASAVAVISDLARAENLSAAIREYQEIAKVLVASHR